MKTPPKLQLNPEFGPMLFADCPFCLQAVPLDAATGMMECQDCRIILELAANSESRVLAPAA